MGDIGSLRHTSAVSLGNGPFPYNDPLLFVIPSEAEESAVRHSDAPNLPVYNYYISFVILRACDFFDLCVFGALYQMCFNPLAKIVILPAPACRGSEAPHGFIRVQRLERGVEGPRRCLSCRCCLEFSDTRAREHDSPYGFLCSLTRKHKLLITQQGRPRPGGPPGASFGGGKGTNSVGTISSSGVLRLRALNPVSPDKICEAPRSG